MSKSIFKHSNVKVNLLTLSFPRELEAEFLSQYYLKSINHTRLATLVAIFFYSLFGFLDAWLVPLEKENLWFIRYALFLPFALTILLFSFTKYFEKWVQPANAAVILGAGLGIIGMILIAPPPAIYSYYAGLILVFIFGYTFFKLRFIWATLAGWMIVAAYEIAAIFLVQTPITILINNNFFFLTGNILGMFACYSIEFYSRKDFIQARELEFERRKVNIANIELENRVAERTFQLMESNRELTQEIAERKRKEEALRMNEEKYRSILENMEEGYFEVNLAGYLTFFNQSTCQILGYSRQELLGMKYSHFAKKDSAVKMARIFNQVYRSGVPAKVTDYVVFRKDGNTRILGLSTSAIRDAEGELVGFRGIARDDTDRKLAEDKIRRMNEELEQQVAERTEQLNTVIVELKALLDTVRKTQNQLVEAEKMAALGSLVAGVAHEINTPVGVAITAASLLAEKTQTFNERYQSGDMKRSDLEAYVKTANDSTTYVLSNIMRAADLIRNFKQVAVDQSSEERRTFKIKDYFQKVLLSLQPKLKRTEHQVRIDCREELEINSYPGSFSQIITNLVMNSLIHGFENIDSGLIVFDISRNNGTLYIRYSDNGAGMDESTVKNIFDPFYTTKRGQGGSGLGLHIVYNIVTQTLGGEIHCDSKRSEGTVFNITIPVDKEKQDDRPAS
ncbi:MAG: PAS domain S-box protein [bacterium]